MTDGAALSVCSDLRWLSADVRPIGKEWWGPFRFCKSGAAAVKSSVPSRVSGSGV